MRNSRREYSQKIDRSARTRDGWAPSGENPVERGTIMKKIVQSVLVMTVLATVFVTNAKAEDPIADWNAISETAVKTAGHAPPVAALDFAIVHLAIYDAVESIDRRYEPYHVLVPGATGSLSAAAAKAGHDVLVGLFPAQFSALDTAYKNFLTANGIDPL